MQTTPLTEHEYYDAGVLTARKLNDLYCLWRLCPRTACRRARACRGAPRRCEAGFELVPSDALDFMEAFEEARDKRMSYDEMIEFCAEEIAALEQWRAQVERSLAP